MDDIVISGISGRFPESDNIEEFKQNLFDGVDLVTEDERRWPQGIYGLPKRAGKLNNLQHLDADFFGVLPKQAHKMDPQVRLLLETTFEAILDAGVNPTQIRGTQVGVFIAVTENEAAEYSKEDPETIDSHGAPGTQRGLLANRVSYAFDFKGPSYAIDTACSSGLSALHLGVAAIKAQECEAAIIGGCHINLQPEFALQLQQLNVNSMEGKCKCFDASADGYVRSETVAVIFLQKASIARRIYATIAASKIYCEGYRADGFTSPSGKIQRRVIQKLYEDLNIDPNLLGYVETHATGTQAGDVQETNAISEALCRNRKRPLPIGSVKSNMGHSEGASGMSSLAKLIVAMESRTIPQNLHYKDPNPGISGLTDGRLQVVSRNEPLQGELVAINSFGIGGTNAHVVLRANCQAKAAYTTTCIPRLVTVSGRTEDAVHHLLQKANECRTDIEFLALLDAIHTDNIGGHRHRGYSLLGEDIQEVSKVGDGKRPIWFVYSGIGSQYYGAIKQLMQVDVFKNSIKKLSSTSFPCGFNLENTLLNSDEDSLENVLNSFICITAVQIALTDVLAALGIEPDGIVGHSLGETACAYADGCLTATQTIMTAYYRGSALLEDSVQQGAMATVGLTWDECIRRCPPGVVPACHNAKDNVTVSGAKKDVESFVEQLNDEHVFARVINTAGKAFHSKYVAKAALAFKASLNKIILYPKPRTMKWISSSVPQVAWKTDTAQLCSPEYYFNNFISPVLFDEAIQYIPDNAIVIEIGPHCVLRSILRRSLNPSTTYCGILSRNHPNNLELLLSNIGLLYNAGCSVKVGQLYEPVSFPVGRNTPSISSLVKWDHSNEWFVPGFSKTKSASGKHTINVDLTKDENQYLLGHVIDGHIMLPATFYLECVWKTFIKLKREDFEKVPVVFENVRFYTTTFVSKAGSLKYSVSIFEETGDFIISEGEMVVMSGTILILESPNGAFCSAQNKRIEDIYLTTDDIYKEFRLRGYNYTGPFCGIVESNLFGTNGKLKWKENWITFIDTMIQCFLLGKSKSSLYLLTGIQRILIDPLSHLQEILQGNLISFNVHCDANIIRSGGVEIRGIKTNLVQRKQNLHSSPKLETYQFIPLDHSVKLNSEIESQLQALSIVSGVMLENIQHKHNLRVVEISNNSCLAPALKNIFDNEPGVYTDYTVVTTNTLHDSELTSVGIKVTTSDDFEEKTHILVMFDLLKQPSRLQYALDFLKGVNGLLLLEESRLVSKTEVNIGNVEVLCLQQDILASKTYIVLRDIVMLPVNPMIIHIHNNDYKWVEPLKDAMRQSEIYGTKIYLVAQNEPLIGLLGLVNCLRKEPGGSNIRSYFINNENAETFQLLSPFYKPQIRKDLIHNILNENGVWGTYRHLQMEYSSDHQHKVEQAYVSTIGKTDLSTLGWIEAPPLNYRTAKTEQLCTVYYAAINNRDIQLASGTLPSDGLPESLAGQNNILGLEFSGRDNSGRRIMGIVGGGGLATSCIIDDDFFWEVPEKWTLADAATIPFAYVMGYYVLMIRGQALPGEAVLIQDENSSIALAATKAAIHMGCSVFIITNSEVRKHFLQQTLPKHSKYIGVLNDVDFEQNIMIKTKGQGIDLVLDFLQLPTTRSSICYLAPGGRLLQVGEEASTTNFAFSRYLPISVSFSYVSLNSIWNTSKSVHKTLARFVQQGIDAGVVEPFSSIIFSRSKINDAFKFKVPAMDLQKIIIEIRTESLSLDLVPQAKITTAIPHTYMNPTKSYVIVGGLGGLGLELANWLILRGATKIVISSRTGIKTGYQALCIKRWREKQVTVVVSRADATTSQGALQVINEANKLGPIGGIFNLAAVFHDALLENLTESDFFTVAQAKIETTKHLDATTQELNLNLDYFVVFSSISSGRGNIGQSNYGFSNSSAERICEIRHSKGLPGMAIQWCLIGDVGTSYISDGGGSVSYFGTTPQNIFSCLDTLDIFLQTNYPIVASHCLADRQTNDKDVSTISLTGVVGRILGITDLNKVSQTATLVELGLDSLVGTEVQQTLSRDYNLLLTLQEIRGLTFSRLSQLTPKQPAECAELILDEYQNNFYFPNRIMPVDIIVKMPSIDTVQKRSVFFIHPIEGHVQAMQELANHTDASVYGLQCTKDCPLNTLSILAEHYTNIIKSIKNKGPYIIVGYSFGACIALEIGLQLEAANQIVKLLLVDGSHTYVNAFSTRFKGTEAYMQSSILSNFTSNLKTVEPRLDMKKLLALNTFDDRITLAAQMIARNTKYELEDIRTALVSYYCKAVAAMNYQPSFIFNGEVSLVKVSNGIKSLGIDYGLNAVCKQDVKIHSLDGDHQSIMKLPIVAKVASILNTIIMDLEA